MPYRKKLDSLNILTKVAIKHNNKYYKLVTKIYNSKINSITKLYYKYISYFNE